MKLCGALNGVMVCCRFAFITFACRGMMLAILKQGIDLIKETALNPEIKANHKINLAAD
jgi:hypothetical protein